MEYFTEEYFRSVKSATPLNEQRMFDSARVESLYKQFDIFLSYNINDAAVVKGIYYALSKMGYSVYLDSVVDPDLIRSATDADTARKLHMRLKNSRSLIYAQSPNAGQSNWMPWELGVVDGNTGKCLIMPVTDNITKASPKREYLYLYPYIRPNILNEMRVYKDLSTVAPQSLKSFLGY